MLLSYGKAVAASSAEGSNFPGHVVDEKETTCWKPEPTDRGPWLSMDLGRTLDVYAVQIVFAGEGDPEKQEHTAGRWRVLGSLDNRDWFLVEDRSKGQTAEQTDLTGPAADLFVNERGLACRFLRLDSLHAPGDQPLCIRGFRVFGQELDKDDLEEKVPMDVTEVEVTRENPSSVKVSWVEKKDEAIPEAVEFFSPDHLPEYEDEENYLAFLRKLHRRKDNEATGFVLSWGQTPDGLTDSLVCYDTSAVIDVPEGQALFARVDSFNEAGITHGPAVQVM